MKKYILAFMAVACMAAFTTTAKAADVAVDTGVKTEASVDANKVKTEAHKEAKKAKHHAKKAKHHAKKAEADAKVDVKASESK